MTSFSLVDNNRRIGRKSKKTAALGKNGGVVRRSTIRGVPQKRSGGRLLSWSKIRASLAPWKHLVRVAAHFRIKQQPQLLHRFEIGGRKLPRHKINLLD